MRVKLISFLRTENISLGKFSSVDELAQKAVVSKNKLKPLVEVRNMQTKHVEGRILVPCFTSNAS
jgi:hypothetical protein